MDAKVKPEDKYIEVDGLKLRYIEEGSGPAVLFLHGASLGSSADVFLRNLGPFARAGFRAIAVDLPGFGLSDIPAKQSLAQQRNAIPKFIDAMKFGKAALIGHSLSGGFSGQLALEDSNRYSHLVILGSGSMVPPQAVQASPIAASQARADKETALQEPTPQDSRKRLEGDTFNHELISDEDVAMRHSRSIGRNFAAHVARQGEDAHAAGPSGPAWKRLAELKMPLLMIYGRQDRAHVGERAELLKQMQPGLDIHVIDRCKHMVHWDAQAEMERLAIPFLSKA